MGRKRDIESIGDVYAQSKAPEENYYLFFTFRHSRDNAGPNEYRIRKESELTGRDKNQFNKMKRYESSISDSYPSIKTYSQELGMFPHQMCCVGPKDDILKVLDEYIDNFSGEIYPEKEIMKRKTEDIFGDIVYNESTSKDKYVLFVDAFTAFNNRKLKGKIVRFSDLSKDDKKLFSMMDPYDVSPKDRDIKAYQLRSSMGPFKMRLAFVGKEENVKSYADAYKDSYGDLFSLEIPMRPKTKKHFEGII